MASFDGGAALTVTVPTRSPEIGHDRDLEQRLADLEALFEEARRRARRRRRIYAAVVLAALGGGAWASFDINGGGAGRVALADGSGAGGEARTLAPTLAALPAGARPSAFAFDPRRPDVVYVTSAHDPGGAYVYKTTDGGRHWQPTGARGAGWMSDILSLTADPRHPGTLYAGTDTAVYKTADGGRSWRPFKQGLFQQSGTARPFGTAGTTSWNRNNGWVLGIAVDPIDSNTVYSVAGAAVRKSTDGGRTWKVVLLPDKVRGERRVAFSRIAIAPTRPESIYAIAHGVQYLGRTAIYESTDAGRHWHTTGGPTPQLPDSGSWDSTDALAVDTLHPHTVYVAVGGTILKTTDSGANWQPATHGLPVGNAISLRDYGLPAGEVTTLATDPQRSGTLYAGLTTGPHTGGIYTSTDGGRSWTSAVSGASIVALAIDPARPATIWAAGWAGRQGTNSTPIWKPRIFRSTNRGHTWTIAG
jgi:photosystem II stability/assembly factor-like uncharacterized protein